MEIRFWFLTRARVAFAEPHNNRHWKRNTHFLHNVVSISTLHVVSHAVTDGQHYTQWGMAKEETKMEQTIDNVYVLGDM